MNGKKLKIKATVYIDKPLWFRFTEKCRLEGRKASPTLCRLIEKYVNGEINI